MVQIDNVKMWESLIEGNSVTYENGMTERGDLAMRIINALKDQGLEYKDGEIVSKEEIKGNQREVSPNPSELTEFEKAIALLIFNSQETCNSIKVCEEQARKESKALLTFARKQITSEIDVDSIGDIDLEDAIYRNTMGRHFDAKRFALDFYRKGIEDTIKKIKED